MTIDFVAFMLSLSYNIVSRLTYLLPYQSIYVIKQKHNNQIKVSLVNDDFSFWVKYSVAWRIDQNDNPLLN